MSVEDFKKKINYKEKETKLWPHFVDGISNNSSKFSYKSGFGFEEEEKEMIIASVFEAIFKGNNFLELNNDVRSQLPFYWNVVVFHTCSSSIINWGKKSLWLKITNILILFFVGGEGGSDVVRRNKFSIKNNY